MKYLIPVILLTLFSCSKNIKIKRKIASLEDEKSCQNEMMTLKTKGINPLGFRDVFSQLLPKSKRPNLNHYVYLPKCLQLREPSKNDVDNFLTDLGFTFRGITPGDNFIEGKKAKELTYLKKRKISPIKITSALKKKPITLVMIPGLASEFLGADIFSELLQKKYRAKSHFFKSWVRTLKRTNKLSPNLFDDQLSLENTTLDKDGIGTQKRLITDLVDISGIPGKNKDLVNVIIFKQPLFSTESITDLAKISKIYNRRLTKIFKLMGKTPENIVLLGYSRGAPIVLEMISQSRDQTWFSNLKGAVSLAGVLYGTEISDEYFCEDMNDPGIGDFSSSKACREFSLIRNFLNKLGLTGAKKSPSFFNKIKVELIKIRNRNAFFDFLKSYMALNPTFDPEAITKLLQSGSKFQELDPNKAIHMALAFGLKTFGVSALTDQYDLNLKKLKILVEKLINSVYQLSTRERLNWWKTSNLPNLGITYYSISSTMSNPANGKLESELMINPYSYNQNTFEFNFLRDTYEGLLRVSNCSLNDSQVTYQKSKFWPKLNQLLNPYYLNHPLQTRDLGIMGTDHWGLALSNFYPNTNGEISPFPRETLLLSIATAISLELN